jgi:hypothetical protein
MSATACVAGTSVLILGVFGFPELAAEGHLALIATGALLMSFGVLGVLRRPAREITAGLVSDPPPTRVRSEDHVHFSADAPSEAGRLEARQLIDEALRLRRDGLSDPVARQRLEEIDARFRHLADSAPPRTPEEREAHARLRDQHDADYAKAISAVQATVDQLKPHASPAVAEKLDDAYRAALFEWIASMR